MNVLVVSSSLRPRSNSEALADQFVKGGQLKTFLDRCNPLYVADYKFRNIYFLATASDEDPKTPERAKAGLGGWIECFEKAEFAGSVFCGGVTDMGDIDDNPTLKQAYFLGSSVK